MKRTHPVLFSIVVAAILSGCSIPRWPVAGTMTSAFGFRMRGWSPDLHNGVDVAADEGAPVRAMKDGTVIHAGEMSGYGLVVMLQHGRNLRTVYGHLSRIAVRSGEQVDGGALIGNVGHTGNATGSHLHFEVWRWGRPDDPVPLLGGLPPGPPAR
jgi:murein DD-endopeptidase MepM/ murein hydrolase activator NlpD